MSEQLNEEAVQDDFLTEEEKHFVIDDDQKADWAVRRIREIKEDFLKWNEFYVQQIEKVGKAADFRCHYLEGLLERYFQTVPHKETKTQQNYQLPSGKLVLKKQGPEYERDDEKLIQWARENAPDYVKTKLSLDWSEMKKTLTVVDGNVADQYGEIVPGIIVHERPDVFRVEVK